MTQRYLIPLNKHICQEMAPKDFSDLKTEKELRTFPVTYMTQLKVNLKRNKISENYDRLDNPNVDYDFS